MLLTDASFAEKIIKKYSFGEVYDFDRDLLVFYKENLWEQTERSSAYYMELALKLLLTFQNYRQSGQKISLNWNMVNQVILKQTAAVSAKAEKILSSVLRSIQVLASENERTREQVSLFRSEAVSRQISVVGAEAVRKQVLTFGINTAREQISVFGIEQEHGQRADFEIKKEWSFISDFEAEMIRRLDFVSRIKKIRNQNQLTANSRSPISVYSALQHGNPRIFQSSRLFDTLIWNWSDMQFLNSFSSVSLNQPNFLSQVQFTPQIPKSLGIRLTVQLGILLRMEESMKRLMGTTEEGSDSIGYRQFHFNIVEQLQSEDSIRNAIEELIRQVQSRKNSDRSKQKFWIFNRTGLLTIRLKQFEQQRKYIDKSHLFQWFRHLTQEESRMIWQVLSESENSLMLEAMPESKGLLESWGMMIYRADNSQIMWEPDKNSLIRLAEKKPDTVLKLFRLLLLSPSRTRLQEQIKRLFHKYEYTIFRQTQQQKEQKTYGFISQRQNKVNLSVRETEERLQAFIELMEKPRVLAAVRKQIERYEVLEAVRRQMKKVHKKEDEILLNPPGRVTASILILEKQEERQMISQVRERFGMDAAQKLERYFSVREHLAGRIADHEAEDRIENSIRSIMDSYSRVNWTETTVTAMGTESEQYLHNQIREKVHEPSERAVRVLRKNLNLMMWLIQKKHRFAQEKMKMVQHIQEHIRTKAVNRFLERNRLQDRFFWNQETEAAAGYLKQESMQSVIYPRNFSEHPHDFDFGTEFPKKLKIGFKAADYEKADQWEEAQTEFYKRQKHQENQIEETRNLVKTLHKKVEIQEKLMAELKQGAWQKKVPDQVNINSLTRQVMRKMEEELRIEKMRRGLL